MNRQPPLPCGSPEGRIERLIRRFFKYKKGWVKFARIILFAVTIAAIARTGYLGGQLVYKHGAGVELALPDFSNPGIDKDE